jgi:hypothetical protein
MEIHPSCVQCGVTHHLAVPMPSAFIYYVPLAPSPPSQESSFLESSFPFLQVVGTCVRLRFDLVG